MKKSKFNLSFLNSTTGNAGNLIPFLLQPTLPNDTFRLSLTSFIRAQPMLAPLMHEVKFFTQYWFVPYRLIWDEWEEFITGGDNLDYAPNFPVLPANTKFQVGSLGDYFGYPIDVDCGGISVMPFRAYAEIWNTRYRDEDLQDELAVSYDSGSDSTTSLVLQSPSWKRDYFTTARPFTQRGNQISVPISQASASSGSYTRYTFKVGFRLGEGSALEYPSSESSVVQDRRAPSSNLGCPSNPDLINKLVKDFVEERVTLFEPNKWYLVFGYTTDSRSNAYHYNVGALGYVSFYIMLTSKENKQGVNFTGGIVDAETTYANWQCVAYAGISTTGSKIVYQTSSQLTSGVLNIRDLRASSALQRYGERSLLWGNRYEEFIQREFGIKPRDSRIQRPEYLGGGKGVLQISEVLQTAEGNDTGVGTMRGHGVAGVSQRPIKFRSPEHGLIIGLLSIRPVPVYTQGVNREFLKKSRLDFFTPELANIGMQEVLQRELFVSNDNANAIFGYSDRYQEYRYNMPKVTGEFRTTLNFWNMARTFSAPPTLNGSFISMSSSKDAFARPFASQNTHQFLLMLRNNIKAYRPIPKRAKNILK